MSKTSAARAKLTDTGDSVDAVDSFREQLEETGAMERKQDVEGAALPPVVISAATWLSTEPPPVDPILTGLFDRGDKVAIVAASKMRKTFLSTQMALCLSARIPFLNRTPKKPRRILLVQFEVKPEHFHRRLRKVARALGIGPGDVGDRLMIVNMRGHDPKLVDIGKQAQTTGAEVIILDPLYKLLEGDENSAQDMKPLLRQFDQLAEQVGAAVVYIHHDPKGIPGSRNIRDRGAGSNTLVRDCDLLITLTAHRNNDEDVAVVSTLQRNYPPQPDFCIRWEDGAFNLAEELPAVAATASAQGNQNPTSKAPLEDFLPGLEQVLNGNTMQKGLLVDRLRNGTGLTKIRADALIQLALEEKQIVMWDKSFPHAIWLGTQEAIDAKIREVDEDKQGTLSEGAGKQGKQTRKKGQ